MMIMTVTTIAAANTARPRHRAAETMTGAAAGDTTDTRHRQAALLPAAAAATVAPATVTTPRHPLSPQSTDGRWRLARRWKRAA